MSSMRPDSRPQGAPFHTSQENESPLAPSHHEAPNAKDAGAATPQRPFGKDDVDTRPKNPLSPSKSNLPSPMRLPTGGQATSAASAPPSTTYAKDVAKKSGQDTAALQRKATAETLMAQDFAAMSHTAQQLCQQLIGMVDKNEGFKVVVAHRTEPQWLGLTCHDLSQLAGNKGIDHLFLAKEMATTFSSQEAMPLDSKTPEEQKLMRNKLRNAITLAVMARVQKTLKPQDVVLMGTRLCRNKADNTLMLEPSGSYGFNAQTLPEEALNHLASLHANLLKGAGVDVQTLVAHPSHPQMQPLVDAIQQRVGTKNSI